MNDEEAQQTETGRPTTYTQELGDLICAKIAEGKSLRKICSDDEMPAVSTVLLWMLKGERGDERYLLFSEQYRVAREAQAELHADEMIEIADDDSGDYGFKEAEDGNGAGAKAFILQDNINRAKLKVHTRQWIAERLRAKKYGNRITQEHTGKDGGAIELKSKSVVAVPGDLENKSVDELTKMFTEVLAG